MKPVTPEQVKRDELYVPFYKPDTWVSDSLTARIFLYMMTPFIPIRFILGWGAAMVNCILLLVLTMFGGKPG
jgi:hypothetical protein